MLQILVKYMGIAHPWYFSTKFLSNLYLPLYMSY